MSTNKQSTTSWADNLRINSIGLSDLQGPEDTSYLDLSPPVFDYDAMSEATVRVADQPAVSGSEVGLDRDGKFDQSCLLVSFFFSNNRSSFHFVCFHVILTGGYCLDYYQ